MNIHINYIKDFMETKENGDMLIRVTNLEQYAKFYLAMKDVLNFKNVDHILIEHPEHYFNAKIIGSTFLITKNKEDNRELCNIAKINDEDGLYKIYLYKTDNTGRFLTRNGQHLMYIADRERNVVYVIKKLHDYPTFSSAVEIEMNKPIFGSETLFDVLNKKFCSYKPTSTYWNYFQDTIVTVDGKNITTMMHIESCVVRPSYTVTPDGFMHFLGYIQTNIIGGTSALCQVSQSESSRDRIDVNSKDELFHSVWPVPILNLYFAELYGRVDIPVEFPISTTRFYLPTIRVGLKRFYVSEIYGEDNTFVLHDIKSSIVDTSPTINHCSIDVRNNILKQAMVWDMDDQDWNNKLHTYLKKNIYVAQQMNNNK